MDLSLPIEKLKNVGSRNLPRLNKLGIKTVKDLLWHFPVRYDDYSRMVPIADIEPGQKVNIQGEILKITNKRLFPKRMFITHAMVGDETGAVKAVWFNQPFIANSLEEGTLVSLAGKVNLDKHGLYLSSPTYEKIDSFSSYNLTHTGRLVPVYPETEGVTSKYLRFLIKPLLKDLDIADPLPEKIIEKYGLPRLKDALTGIHYPSALPEAQAAKERLAFDDLLLFQLKALLERRKLNQLKSVPVKFNKDLVQAFISRLPFELTTDQKIAAWEILKDLEKTYPMNRLLEGDVGSGKTVVALLAAVQIAKAGYQSVFMAPTEVLANQHFTTMTELLGEDLNIALLTGTEAKLNNKTITKLDLKKKIAGGEVDLIVGTHAVIQKDVRFKNLAFVIIDEQHRFGIQQRRALLRGSTRIDTQINADNNKLLYEDLTYKIRGVFFDVYNNLGPGHKESVYHKALIEEFTGNGLSFETEKIVPIIYNGKKIGEYKPDLIIEDKIIIELKAIPFIGKTEEKQLWTYLKGSEYKVAFLVNFSNQELQIKRVVYDTARNQRSSASNPRESALQVGIPHLLSMTATPIPRTLALTVYGDLDISLIKERPKNRQKIITKVVSPSQRKNAYKFIRDEVMAGRQVFVICPRIEDPRTTDQRRINTDNRGKDIGANPRSNPRKSALSQMRLVWADVKAVEEEYKKLSEEIFPDLKMAMLHGKMKPKEKNEIMEKFKDKKFGILVSTSVIEVGVDIPNATIMMIENAERFGLAQLHQFRGRVGRGEHQSYCLLFSSTPDKSINQRLKALVECDDGFLLAEKDMAIRGPGEFFGVKQSGLPDLAMASLANVDLIKKARAEARTLLKEDSNLTKYPLLKEHLERFQKLTHFE